MDVQSVLVFTTALGAAAYLVRQTWRTWSGSNCSGGCCKQGTAAKETPLIAAEELFARVRGRS